MSKKLRITFLVLFIIIATVLLTFAPTKNEDLVASANDYLRIHVRANSNNEQDQAVKYLVKDKVVELITPYIKECKSKKDAIEIVSGLKSQLEKVCQSELENNGYYYGANACVKSEKFPTRVYGDLTLESGEYDALIIELGSGKGDNWWCVLYPPLCFTSSQQSVEYRSLIYDIIKNFFNK